MKLRKPNFDVEDKILREHLIFEAAVLLAMQETKEQVPKMFARMLVDMLRIAHDHDEGKDTPDLAEVIKRHVNDFLRETDSVTKELKGQQMSFIEETYPELARFDYNLSVECEGREAFAVKLIDIWEHEHVAH
jgi:hypothetical protein